MGLFVNPFFLIRRPIFKQLRDATNDDHFHQVLDFGCGSSPYKQLIDHECYIGVDTYASGHDHRTSKINTIVDGEHLPFRDDSFDLILATEVIEHIDQPDKVLKEFFRILKPGGTLIVTVPFSWPEHEQPFDFKRYTQYGLKNLLINNNFKKPSVAKYGTLITAVGLILIFYISEAVKIKKWPKVLRLLFNVLILCPLTIIFMCLSFFLPKNDDFFIGLFAVCKK